MTIQILLLTLGLGLIIKGGDLFVSSSVRIAELLRMPRVVIGSTLVSLATTSPELVVSIIAGLKGDPGIAVGNAVGSAICNMTLILGISAVMRLMVIHPRALLTPLVAMFGSGILLCLLTIDLVVSQFQGAILLVVGVAYLAWDFRQHWRNRRPADIREAKAIETEMVKSHPTLQTPRGAVIQFLFGAALVILGSRLLVDSAVGIAAALGVPSIVIGLSVVAFGTSLPELVTAVTSARKDVSDLAVGNILGANVLNLTLIVGTAASLHEMSMTRLTQLFNFPALLLGMVLLLVMMLTGRRITRTEGVVLLAYYTAYIVILISLTTSFFG